MRRHSIAITALAIAMLAGCQSSGSGTLYSKDTFTSAPTRSAFGSDVAFVAAYTIYQYPRKCRWVTTSDGLRTGSVHRPGKFSISQIIENKHDDGWFRAAVQPIDAVHNSLPFFVNARTGAWACSDAGRERVSASNSEFANGKFHDPPTGLTSNGAATSKANTTKEYLKRYSTRSIVINWEGRKDPIVGKIELNQRSGGGNISMALPNNEGNCSGYYYYAKNSRTTGTWSFTCTNRVAASGTFRAYGSGKGSSGEGVDTTGRKVTYRLGGVTG